MLRNSFIYGKNQKAICSYACIILGIEQFISWIDNNLVLDRIKYFIGYKHLIN